MITDDGFGVLIVRNDFQLFNIKPITANRLIIIYHFQPLGECLQSMWSFEQCFDDSNQNIFNENQREHFLHLHQPILDSYQQHSEEISPSPDKQNTISHCQQQPTTNVKVKLSLEEEDMPSPSKKKKKKKSSGDYKKNICGYIIKKSIRQLCKLTFVDKIQELCQRYGCSVNEVKSYYMVRMEDGMGPNHIEQLLVGNSQEQVPIKKVFGEYLVWFLRERYLRYLMNEGKMSKKIVYIKYKNKQLLQLVLGILSENSSLP